MVRMSPHCGMQRPFIDSTVTEKDTSMSRIFIALLLAMRSLTDTRMTVPGMRLGLNGQKRMA